MIEEVIRELKGLKDTDEVTSNQILIWAQSVKPVQKEVLDNIRDANKFDSVR